MVFCKIATKLQVATILVSLNRDCTVMYMKLYSRLYCRGWGLNKVCGGVIFFSNSFIINWCFIFSNFYDSFICQKIDNFFRTLLVPKFTKYVRLNSRIFSWINNVCMSRKYVWQLSKTVRFRLKKLRIGKNMLHDYIDFENKFVVVSNLLKSFIVYISSYNQVASYHVGSKEFHGFEAILFVD